jgi:anti-sigma B factor antagonist
MRGASSRGADGDEFAVRHAERPDGSVLVSVTGDVDLHTAPQLQAELDRLAWAGRATTLDLSEVDFIDSVGLKLLLGAAKPHPVHDGWTFLLSRKLHDEVARRLELTGVRDLLPFER